VGEREKEKKDRFVHKRERKARGEEREVNSKPGRKLSLELSSPSRKREKGRRGSRVLSAISLANQGEKGRGKRAFHAF